jgi:hypothetical protein
MTKEQFNALRFWAMTFSTYYAVRPGIATWPLFRYTPEQRERLRAIGRSVSTGARLIWVTVFALIWALLGFIVAMIPLVPLIATPLGPPLSEIVVVALPIAIGLNLLSAWVIGAVAATWIAGRLTAGLILPHTVSPENGDTELLAHIQRQIGRALLFWVVAAAAPLLLSLAIRSG